MLLVIAGVGSLVYKILTEDGDFILTKSVGFIVFMVGLLAVGIGKSAQKSKEQ